MKILTTSKSRLALLGVLGLSLLGGSAGPHWKPHEFVYVEPPPTPQDNVKSRGEAYLASVATAFATRTRDGRITQTSLDSIKSAVDPEVSPVSLIQIVGDTARLMHDTPSRFLQVQSSSVVISGDHASIPLNSVLVGSMSMPPYMAWPAEKGKIELTKNEKGWAVSGFTSTTKGGSNG